KWKDITTKSVAQVKGGRFKLSKKGGVSYGLDGTPQGAVEVQVRFGASADVLCTRFAAPAKPKDDRATKYKAKVFDAGAVACSPVPPACAPCAPPTTTTSTSTSTSTSTTSSTIPSCGAFVTSWGTTGNADGQLMVPYDVVTDGLGHVIVADSYNH